MHLTARDLLVATAAFGIAYLSLPAPGAANQDPQPPKVKQPRTFLRGQLPKMTSQEKIAAALRQLKIATKPKGITSMVEICPHAPFVKDMAYLSCFNDIQWSAGRDPDSTGSIT